LVGGKVAPPKGVTLSGFTIELVDQKTRWRSGKIPVGNDGVFTTTLRAEPGERNVYAIDLRDSAGSQKKTSPESLTYTIGAAVGEQVLMHAIGVALTNNECDRVFEKGHGLPAKKRIDRYAASALKKGQSGAALRIPVVEGEADRADRNKLVGCLEISAEAITRDLPIGSAIEVTIRIDESRIVTVQAYVPVLDADFEATAQMGTVTRHAADITADVDAEIARLSELKNKAAATGDQAAGKLVAEVESGQLLSEVQQLAAGARDGDTAAKCESRLLELKSKLDRVDDKLQWPTLAGEAEDFIERLSAVLQQDGTPEQKKEGEVIIAEMRTTLKTRNSDDLKRKQAQGESLYWRIASEQPKFWVGCFQYLEKDIERMADQERAARLFEQGRAYISHNNATGLQNVVRELWKMLPEERVQEAKERGYQGGLRKAG
jgi:molecular chaperone DnaK